MTGAPLGIGRVISDTVRLSFRSLPQLFLIGFVPALLSAGIAGLAGPGDSDPMAGPSAADLWAGLIDLLLGTLVTGVLCLGALDARLGKRHGVGQYLQQAARHFVPLLVFGVVLSIAIAIGVFFLIVPGLYVAARYLPYVVTTVFEDRGWQGTNRAEELTKGYRWPLVGTLLIFGIALIALFMVAGIPAAALGASLGLVPAILVSAALTAVSYVIFAAFSAVVYLRLRELGEGTGPDEVAAEID